MSVKIVKNGDDLSYIQSEIEKINGYVEVFIRPMQKKASNAQISHYWIQMRKIANDQGIGLKEAHRLSMEATGAIVEQDGEQIEFRPFDLSPRDFYEYAKSVYWYWQPKINVDLEIE